jgi:ankyrin repeat protein
MFVDDAGVDINTQNSKEQTPLFLASGCGKIEVTHLLLKHGADVNCCDKEGWTPLHTAARNGHLNVVQLLLDHGISVQVRNGNARLH